MWNLALTTFLSNHAAFAYYLRRHQTTTRRQWQTTDAAEVIGRATEIEKGTTSAHAAAAAIAQIHRKAATAREAHGIVETDMAATAIVPPLDVVAMATEIEGTGAIGTETEPATDDMIATEIHATLGLPASHPRAPVAHHLVPGETSALVAIPSLLRVRAQLPALGKMRT